MELEPGPLHASAVRMAGKGVLLVGASGSGKSSLALHLMGLGAELVSDDRVTLLADGDGPRLARPEASPALIEARGVGLLHAACVASAPLHLVVDLGTAETARLPPLRCATCAGFRVPLFHNVTNSTFPVVIQQYLLHGRKDPDF
jgi:HPr kinase/phosphorylase